MLKTLVNAWKTPELKRKIVITLVIVLLYRLGACIPVPYIDGVSLSADMLKNSAGTIFGYLNQLSGQAFSQATLFALSVSPYITAQIVIQLLTVAIPALERLSKDGQEGKRKINKIIRILTVVLAVVTAYGYYTYLDAQGYVVANPDHPWFSALVAIACYCAGASLIMWLAEKIDENGIGNGISIILFVNILSSGYSTAMTLYYQIQRGGFLNIFFAILSVVMMVGIITLTVFITNSERRIPIQYAKRVVGRKMYGGQNSNLPLKLNMSGVMPIIFANSIVALPATINMFVKNPGKIWSTIVGWFSPTSFIYVAIFICLIVAFAYFYIAISFNTVEVSNNLKKNGGFIPGIRPGKPTSDYVKMVLNRITLVGALFLAFIAGLPIIINICASGYLGALTFGGSSILIVVGVALETARELESQMAMRHYKGFLE